MYRFLRLCLAAAAVCLMLSPELAEAKVRGTTRSFSKARTGKRARGRRRAVRVRRAKPNRVRVRRVRRRRLLSSKIRKIVVRKRSDLNESELGPADGLRNRGKAKKAKEPVFGPE
ncbi:MAG: hypothetical protein KJO07_21620 [Deltaproteobacteria bacterium]|nr:hypothetical protein [Deltaproteobacteria bacterium]